MRKIEYYIKKYDVFRSEDFGVPSTSVELLTDDGINISASLLDGPPGHSFVFAHGLMGHRRAPGLREFATSLSRYGPVLTIDLRGHGLSDGCSTLGRLEAHDVAAAIAYMKVRTTDSVTVVGFSMGAVAAVRAAALVEPPDALVAVSGLSHWHGPRGWAARRTEMMWTIPGSTRLVRALTGVRLEPKWRTSEAPVELVGSIAPVPLLVVHGEEDPFFPVSEAEDLFAAAGQPKALWRIPTAGHAEGLFMTPAEPVVESVVGAFVDELIVRLEAVTPSLR